MSIKRPRFPAIKKRPDGTRGCRGCGGDIPPHRQTWCSHDCHLKFDPFYVKQAVRKRCCEMCEMCGKDCSRKAQSEHESKRPKPPSYVECGLGWPYDSLKYLDSPQYNEFLTLKYEWSKQAVRPEYDHIVPHSEGGDFVLENIRLICRSCHLERTRDWRRNKSGKVRHAN